MTCHRRRDVRIMGFFVDICDDGVPEGVARDALHVHLLADVAHQRAMLGIGQGLRAAKEEVMPARCLRCRFFNVGESWPGLLSGSQKHYDASGRYIGYSARGFVADMVHHDTHGKYIGETHIGFFGQKNHYSADRGYVGETWDDFTGDTTELSEVSGISDSQDCDDSFGGGEW